MIERIKLKPKMLSEIDLQELNWTVIIVICKLVYWGQIVFDIIVLLCILLYMWIWSNVIPYGCLALHVQLSSIFSISLKTACLNVLRFPAMRLQRYGNNILVWSSACCCRNALFIPCELLKSVSRSVIYSLLWNFGLGLSIG